jgi:ribosomal protein S19
MKRSKWKGIYVNPKNFTRNNEALTPFISRSSCIIPNFVDKVFKVHSGKNFKEIKITKDMLGHKFGEFFRTRAEFVFKKKKKKK